jgi:hypothetical protein
MKRILILSNPQSPGTDYYRTIGPFCRLEETNPTAVSVRIVPPDKISWYDIFSCDIFLIQRPNGNEIVGFIQEAKSMGKKILIDMDDLLHGISQSSPAYKHFNSPGIPESIDKCLTLADYIIFSTQALQDYYTNRLTAIIGKCSVVQNGFDPVIHAPQPIRKQATPARFMWRGSMSHLGDMQTIKNALNRVAGKHKFDLALVGMPPFLGYDLPPAKYIDWQTLFTYFRLIREAQPDYGFFPLEDIFFNHCKSNIFAIEMLMAGALPIVTDGFSEFNIPGLARFSTPKQFENIIELAIDGKLSRIQRIEEGRKYVIENFHIDKMNYSRLEIVNSI